jgi:predicted nucleic acid-binding Zn ribbon protein
MALNPAGPRINDLIYRLGGEKHRRFIHIFMNWKPMVGELLSQRSHPIKIDRDILFVAVENSAWMQELVLLKEDIIKKYRKKCHEDLSDIIFIIKTKRKKK